MHFFRRFLHLTCCLSSAAYSSDSFVTANIVHAHVHIIIDTVPDEAANKQHQDNEGAGSQISVQALLIAYPPHFLYGLIYHYLLFIEGLIISTKNKSLNTITAHLQPDDERYDSAMKGKTLEGREGSHSAFLWHFSLCSTCRTAAETSNILRENMIISNPSGAPFQALLQ